MITKKYRFYYTTDDWVDVRYTVDKYDEIIKLSINYTAIIKDSAYSIVRYDNAHGYLHIHRYWKTEPEIIMDLTNEQVIKKARKDIDKNWRKYRLNLEKILGDM